MDEYLDTLVKRGATLGANCTVVCGVTIGEHAFVGAGSVVTHDVVPYALVMGVPARQVGWMSPFGERHSAWWWYAGWKEIYNPGLGGVEVADDVTPLALDWIQRNAKKDNWFLHVNYWDPHTPYRAPLEFGNPFEHDPLPGWFTEGIIEQPTTQCMVIKLPKE